MSGLDLTNYDSSALRGSYAWTDTLRGVHYGPGSLSTALPKLLALLGAKRALIVTGKSLREKVRLPPSPTAPILTLRGPDGRRLAR